MIQSHVYALPYDELHNFVHRDGINSSVKLWEFPQRSVISGPSPWRLRQSHLEEYRAAFGVEFLFLTLSIFHEGFLLIPGLFPKNEEISTPPPCGFLVGILFYENGSTESFRKNEWSSPPTVRDFPALYDIIPIVPLNPAYPAGSGTGHAPAKEAGCL